MKRFIHGGERRWEPADDDRAWFGSGFQDGEPIAEVVERLVRPTPPKRRWYDGCWWLAALTLAADAGILWGLTAVLEGWWP